jgi:hypothetical protein
MIICIVTAAGANIEMVYVQYKQLLIKAHGIELIGWPKDVPFANPSKILQIAELNMLHATLSEGNCH